METCISDIRCWMAQNTLKLNDDKTEVIIFGSKHQLSNLGAVSVKIGDTEITPSPQVKNLGVCQDSQLTMEKHVTNVCRTGHMHLRNISRIRRFLTVDATKSIVNSLVTSRLDYANALLVGTPQSLTDRLQRVQNASARIITKSARSCHITPILKGLHWLSVKARVAYKALLHTYRALNGLAPSYIRDMLQVYTPSRSLRSETQQLLTIPKIRTNTFGSR